MTNTDGNQASLGELRYWIKELIEELKVRPSTQHDDFGAAWALAEKVEHQRLALGFPEMANVCPCEHGYWVDTSDPVFGIKRSLGFGYIARADLHNRDKLRKNLEAWLRQFERPAESNTLGPCEVPTDQETEDKPRWDRDTGKLLFRNQLAKKVVVGKAKNVVPVLDCFQLEHWPHRISDPLPYPDDAMRLHATIKSLNYNLSYIHFRADGTGKGFIWEQLPDISLASP